MCIARNSQPETVYNYIKFISYAQIFVCICILPPYWKPKNPGDDVVAYEARSRELMRQAWLVELFYDMDNFRIMRNYIYFKNNFFC